MEQSPAQSLASSVRIHPFLVLTSWEFLFWDAPGIHWVLLYKVLAAAVLSILAHLLAQYYTELVNFSDPATWCRSFRAILLWYWSTSTSSSRFLP